MAVQLLVGLATSDLSVNTFVYIMFNADSGEARMELDAGPTAASWFFQLGVCFLVC